MIDIAKLCDQYMKDISVRHGSNGEFVAPPFYHIGSDESIALGFYETADGRIVVSDCGTTKDYLELMDVSIGKYRKKLDAIKERFFIEEVDGAFVMTMPTNSPNAVQLHLGYFIQAICVIANIDL